MIVRFHRRCLAVLVAVTLSLGLVAHGVAAAGMNAGMVSAATDGGMSSMDCCDGSPEGEGGMPMMACALLCGSGSVATLEDAASLEPLPLGIAAVTASSLKRGRDGPPDPYPPRPAGLS